jgi:macrolide transport system ATP-binding/permease protein
MAYWRRVFARIRALLGNKHAEDELAREVAAHLALLADDLERRGMSPEEARRAAKRAYGGVEQAKQAHRDERSFLWVEQLGQDLRYALRVLAKSPGFSAVAIITLALGIGANTAIFSEMDAVMLRSLPVPDPQRLVILEWNAQHEPKLRGRSSYGDCALECSFSVPFFESLRSRATTLASVAAMAGPLEVNFSGNGPANITRGLFVSGDFFATVGVKAFLGRWLTQSDDLPSASPAIVLDYGYWQRAFGADPSAVGRLVRINNVDSTIVGVSGPGFTGLTPGKGQDFFLPLSLARRVKSEWWGAKDRLSDSAIWWVAVAGRLKPETTLAQAQTEATTLFQRDVLHGAKPIFSDADGPRVKLSPARQALDGQSNQIAPMLKVTMAAVGLVLLIACANVAGLVLARSAKRRKELAVRQALGAGRARIARQLLTESVLLAMAGGALGVLLAIWGVETITKFVSSGLDRSFPFVILPDWRVLFFTTALTLATGILCGLAPAMRGGRGDLTPSLKENAPTNSGVEPQAGWRFRLGDALVVGQVALSIVVLVGAGLLVRTLQKLQSVNPGFDTQNVLLFGINPTLAGYKDPEATDLYRQLRDRFAALPGVVSASYSESALLSGSWSGRDVHMDGAPAKSNVNTATFAVGPDFLSAMRIPLVAGRAFTTADLAEAEATNAVMVAAEKAANAAAVSGTPAVRPAVTVSNLEAGPQPAPVSVIVNETFAKKFFPGQNPVGRHIGDGQEDEPAPGPQPGYLIVGVAGDTKYDQVQSDIKPTMFMPLVGKRAHFELRTVGDPAVLVNTVRGIVAQTDSNLPLFEVRTQTQQIEQSLFQQRFVSRLSSIFAFLAMVLACLGLYGLLSYEVARRTRELGIRIALGAQRRNLMRLVVWRGLMLAIAGAIIGIGASMAVTRLMASLLYRVAPNDPATIGGVSILLMAVALAACLMPARRAMSIDPMVALRDE